MSIGNAWGDVTYDLTGYSTQIANGWTHDYGDIYVGRKGSNYDPTEGGLPTGNGNIFAAFQVTESSSIRVVFVWTKTNGDLSGKQIDLASINKATYDKLTLASTGTGNDVKYSIDNFSSSQHSAVAINRSDANKEINIDFETTVSAGYYAVYTASSINASALIKKIIVTPAAASCEDAPTVSSITKGATTATTQVMNCAGITSLGSEGCTISSYGFVYGTSANPTISDTKVQVGTTYTTTGTAFATTTLTGLTPNTTYYVRAYATNGAGTAYSSGDSFTTPASIGNVVYIAGSADASNDAIKALRDANYVVTVRTKAGSPNYEGVDLVVLDESLSWGSSSDEVGTVIAADVPILNLKAFFYTLSSRWNWGTPVNPGSTSELATLSTEYSNVSSHPIFDGVTISEGAVDMIGTSKSGNNLQGVTTNTLVEGKEGYTLATCASGTTCIHELTPAQRGVTNSKYLLIALSNNVKDNYSADAKKMIVNAAAYLIDNSEQWAPATSCAAIADAGADKETTENVGVAMAATAATSGYTGAWSIKAGSPSTDAGQLGTTSSNTMTFTPNTTGTYTLVWTVTDNSDGTCSASDEATVTVSEAPASGWYLKGSFDEWGDGYAMAETGTNIVSVERTLDANSHYQFKIVNGSDWYGNGEIFGGTKTKTVSDIGTSNNCHLITSEEGKYRFDYNTETNALTITYPNSYTYYYSNTGNWEHVYVYKFSDNEVTGENAAWPGVEITTPTSLCGEYYAATSDGYAKIIFTNGLTGDNEKKTSDMVVASADAGKYVAGTGDTWTSMPTFSVTYNKNGDGAGNDGAVTGNVPTDATAYSCGAEVTVSGNTGSLALNGYSFNGWNTAPNGTGTAKVADETYAISDNTTFYAQWLQEIPTSVAIGGTWKYFPGQTITLTTTPTDGTSDFTYQWQQSNGSAWEDIEGANSDTYTKENCAVADARKYRCIISKLGASVTSNEFKVHIYTLEGDYSGGSDWKVYNIAQTSGTVGTVAVTLNASSLFEFGIKDNYDNTWYRNTNFIIDNWTNEGFGQGSGNCRLFTGPEGYYTFTVDIAHVGDGTPYMEVSVAYPSVSHPAAGYAYFKKWGDWAGYYIHWWYNDGSDHPLTEWGSDVHITNETTICGTDYIYFPVIANYNQLKIKDAAGDGSHYTGDLSSVGSSGKYFDFTNDNAWNAFPAYTVTFNSNGGSAVDEQHVGCGETATEPTAPTRLNYDFEGWQLAGVDYNFATVVDDDITLDAVWTRKAISGSEEDIVIIDGTTVNTGGTLSVGHYFSAGTANSHVKYAGAIGGGNGCRFTTFTLPAGSSAVVKEAVVYTAKTFVIIPSSQVSGIDFENNTSSGCTISYADPYFSLTGASGGKNQTEASVSTTIPAGTYYCGSTGNGLEIGKLTLTVTTSAPSVKLKVNGEVTQTISITVGEKLGEIFVSGSLPTLDLPGYTFNGWKNEVGDAAVDNNTVISGSMVIYADLTAHEYSVALENGETDGAATVHYGETALNITTAVSGEEGDELDGFYTAATEGTKVADADGTLVASITGYTDENGKWIKTSDATLYTIWIPYVPSSDATLSDLTIGGETVDGFDAATISYDVELPFGTTVAPTIAGTANDAKAKSVVVTQAASANGDATVVVTAEDNSTKTYTIHFSVVATKDIELVWATDKQRCDATTPSAKALIATASTYLSASYTGSAAEGGSLTTNKTTGSKIIITAQPGYAFKAMGFYGKIEDGTCNFYNNGVVETIGTSTGDACYSDVFSNDEVHEFVFELTGTNGIYIRNMQLTMIQACTPKTIAWTTEPAAEYELGSSPDAIAASANNGPVSYASTDGDVIAVNESTGALTLKTLGTVTLSASVPAGDGVTYCDEGAQISKANIATYYLVTFNAQNGTPVTTTKYYKNDAAIALPATPVYAGFNFLGWFDAAEGGNAVTSAITPTASRTIYAHWEAQCEGPMITTQSGSRSYFVGREAATLVGVASAGGGGELTYTWYSCDDAERTNPVALAEAPTPSTAEAGVQYYYFTVTEAGCDVVATSDVIVITVTEKDQLLLIKIATTGGSNKTVTGYCAKAADCAVDIQNDRKFGSNHYMKMALNDEEFQAGDIFNVHITTVAESGTISLYSTNGSQDALLYDSEVRGVVGNNRIPLTDAIEGRSTLYLCRTSGNSWNAYVDFIEVYRPYPVPVLTAMTINGNDATIAGTNVTATIAANAELASLDIVPTFMSNDPTQTEGDLGDWSEVSEGVYTASYVVTDKDEDTNTYNITLTRDVEITSITISGETSVAEESQITLTATVLPNNVANKAITWSSSDETKAEVDENGVVTAKAAGAVTITATSVADNTKFGTYDITVTGYIGTKRVYWFAYADDATENGATNNSTVFGSAPTGTTSGAKEITLEEGWVVNTTKKAGAPGSTGTFVVPAEYTATFYAVVKGSGSSGRYIQLKQGDVVKYTSDEFGSTDPTIVKIEGVVAGTYTINYDGGMSNFYLYAAELSRYAITSVTLESGFTLRTEDSRTPDMTLIHAKAAIASQTWSIVSSTATGTTINESTGEITAGTTPGTITVQVVVEDVMGNEVTSNICTVEIVEEFERINVTSSMTWNWNELSMSNVNVSTDRGLTLANYIEGEKWQMLNGTNGDYAYRNEAGGCYEAMNGSSSLSFYTTIPGMVKISGKRRSSDAVVKINGEITVGTVTSSGQTFEPICVAPGEVTITPDANGMRITKLEFIALSELNPADAEDSKLGGYERTVNPQYYGTVCLPKAGVMTGAMLFQVAYMDYKEDGSTPYKVYYDQVENGVMQAGMPYIFLAEESTIGVYYTGTAEETAKDHNGLHGTLVNITEGMNATGIYMLYNNQVVHSTNAASTLPANRAYLQISEIPGYGNPSYVAPAPKYRRISTGFNGVNTTTGMDEIEASETPMKVMIEGQIFIIRGEKMYDATGRLVK